MELLDAKGIVRVPVTEDGRLVGVISRSDVTMALIEPQVMTQEIKWVDQIITVLLKAQAY